jgi:hypothetical protein
MLADARIRLEGRLEELERATRALELARPQVQRGNWPSAQAALAELASPRLVDATGQAQALTRAEPELVAVLRRVQTAREGLVRAIEAKARDHGIAAASVEAKLEALAAQKVLFEREGSRGGVFAILFLVSFALAVTLGLAVSGPAAAAPFILAGICVFGWLYGRAPCIVVAQDVLVIDGTATPIADIERATLQPGLLKGTQTLTLRLKHGSIGFSLSIAPDGLVAALKSLGIEISRHEQWWP